MFYLIQWKAFQRLFIKLFQFTGKLSANNYKLYRKLIQKDSKSYNQYILFKIAAAACQASGLWRVHVSAFCRSAHNTLVLCTGVGVARILCWGGLRTDGVERGGGIPLPSRLRGRGSVISSPCGVRGENGFWCILSLKKRMSWWQIWYFCHFYSAYLESNLQD